MDRWLSLVGEPQAQLPGTFPVSVNTLSNVRPTIITPTGGSGVSDVRLGMTPELSNESGTYVTAPDGSHISSIQCTRDSFSISQDDSYSGRLCVEEHKLMCLVIQVSFDSTINIPETPLTSFNAPHKIWLDIRSAFPHEWIEYFSLHGEAALCDEFDIQITPGYMPNSFSFSTFTKGARRQLPKSITIRSFCVLLGNTILLLRHTGGSHTYTIYGRIFLYNRHGFPIVYGPESYFSDRFDRQMQKLLLEVDHLNGHARKIEMMPIAKKSALVCELWKNEIEREKSFFDERPYLQSHYIIPLVISKFDLRADSFRHVTD